VARVNIFLVAAALVAGMAGYGGTCNIYPPPYNPPPSQNLEIRTWYDLDAVRDNLAGNHTLMNDLDSTTAGYEELASLTANQGKGWEPIEFTDPYYPDHIYSFTGSFDGQGYKIHDLVINRPDENCVGLFCITSERGVIQNIGVVNVTVIGGWEVGGLVGHNQGAVSNSYVTGSVTGEGSYVGGLIGCINDASVTNSYSTGSMTGDSWVGGLVGGGAWSTVSNSYSTASVTGDRNVGGLVGLDFYDLTVSNSFWDIQTSGQATSAGGTGKNTTEMQDITTFSGAGWNVTAVALNETNPTHIWNIVNNMTYPFLSWQS